MTNEKLKLTTIQIPVNLLDRIKKYQTRSEPAYWDVIDKMVAKYEQEN